MGTINKPNLIVPLAPSYNERGLSGYTNVITKGIDQRKINCLYEISKNPVTGSASLNLSKRPGVLNTNGSWGTSAQVAYLIFHQPGTVQIADLEWVFSKTNNDIQVSDNATTKTIFSSGSSFIPCYIDRSLITSTDTVILQCKTGDQTPVPQRVFFTSGSIGAAWTEITDGDFTSLIHKGKMEFMDGFALVLDQSNRVFNSDINSLANWNPSNFTTNQIKQDYPVGLARLNNQILVFGFETVTPYYNAGNASGSPLSPIKQLHNRIGLNETVAGSGTHYYAILESRLYFVSRLNSANSLSVHSYNGETFEKISTPFVEKILQENNLIYSVNATSFNGKNAIAIVLTQPNAANQVWLMFFPDLKEWFEWNSTTFTPINNGVHTLGVFPNHHKLYFFSPTDNWQDAGTSYQYLVQFKLPDSGPELKKMGMFGVNGDTGSAGAANTILVEFSDDDYQSFKTAGTISLSSDNKTLKRGGAYRNRAVRLSNTNANETRLQSFIALVK